MTIYSSEGILQAVFREGSTATEPADDYVFYFAGRPVAQAAVDSGGAATLTFLTTDHLGTPALATDIAGALLWQGGFEPFGQDYAGAQAAGVFLRFPGQWEDEAWGAASLGAEVSYNVHRWYQAGTGKYSRVDPLSIEGAGRARLLGKTADQSFQYANARPMILVDPLGLEVLVCQRPNEIPQFQGLPVLGNLPHRWIKTGRFEAGLGEAGGVIPGDQLPPGCGCPETEVVDHTGQSEKAGATCRLVSSVDEDCVDSFLEIGKRKGRWFPGLNDCWAFVRAVVSQCTNNPGRPKYRQNHCCPTNSTEKA